MVERIDIERALDALASDEQGMKFQGLAVVLGKERWRELVACERHKDLGLDAYAPGLLSPDGRGMGLASSTTGSFRKLNEDAEKAHKNYCDVRLFIFYTTGKVSQPKKAEWADKIRAAYGYELVVMSREEIIACLQLPDNAAICRTHLNISVPYQPSLVDVRKQAQEAASAVAADWAAHPRIAGKPRITLDAVVLDGHGRQTREIFNTADLRGLLLRGRRLVLEGPAGRGKSTTLIQLAEAGGVPEAVPFLVDLPAWVRSPVSILDYIARMPQFLAHGIDPVALARLAQNEPCMFLLNGWNEISNVHAQDAATALHGLERDFPKAGIIVATRAQELLPGLPGSTRLRLLALSPAQRLSYLEQAIGSGRAHELNAMLTEDQVLNELTQTPLILSEVTTIFNSGGEIPRTKLGLLGAVVRVMEQSDEHKNHLRGLPLMGGAEDYLRALAIRLTSRGEVIIGEAEARTICYSVSEGLKNRKQIGALPEPSDLLDALCKHHILEPLDYPTVGFRFEHQQFQEYYAALMLRERLADLVTTRDLAQRKAFGREFINEPAWEEQFVMVAEALGASDGDAASVANVAAGGLLVRSALEVDPLFAAGLARLCGPSVWQEVRSDLGLRLRALYATDNLPYKQIALAAMLATGSEDFADVLVPLITSADQQTRLATYRAGPYFHPSSLGAQWKQVVAGWQEQMRVEFVSELTIYHRLPGIALYFARSDPGALVRIEAIQALGWVGQHQEVSELLQAMTDSEFRQAIQGLHAEEIPPALRSRAISGYKDLMAQSVDPKMRFRISMAMAELGDIDSPTRLSEELAALPSQLVKELSDYSLQPAVEIVRKANPQWVSLWVADRIIEGTLWRDTWLPLVLGIPDSLREELLQRVCNENLRHGTSGQIIPLLAATAEPVHAKVIFAKLCEHRRRLLVDAQNQEKQEIDRQLRDLFHAVPGQVAVEGLSDMLTKLPDGFELSLVTEIFSRMGSLENSLRDLLPDHLRQQLRRYLKAAVPGVLGLDDFRGEDKARLASALAEVGEPEDSADLLKLIRADIERVRSGRPARAQGDQSAKAQGSVMSYSHWHVQALIRLDHAAAELAVVDLLKEPEYELDAAWALVTIAKKLVDSRSGVTGRFGVRARDYRTLRTAPPEWCGKYNETRRVKFARAIKERITDLLEESRSGDHKAVPYHHRLKELATTLAELDPKHSADLIMEIAAHPARFHGWKPVELLEALLFGGVSLAADRVISTLEPVVAEVRSHGAHDGNAGLLKRLLSILPFVNPQPQGIAHIRQLLTEFRLPLHDQRDLLVALGQSGCDEGLALLRDFARQSDATFEHMAKDWIEAVAACPLPGAKSMLLSLIDPEVIDGVGGLDCPEYSADLLASCLSDLARADTALVDRVLGLTGQDLSLKRRLVLAKIVARLDTAQSALAGLNLIDDNSPQPIPYDLGKFIEDIFLEKRPYKGSSQSYTLVPRAASDLRKRLFEMAESDSRRTRSACSLLGQIEEWRLEHGRPSSEPRHPAYESGKPWPPFL